MAEDSRLEAIDNRPVGTDALIPTPDNRDRTIQQIEDALKADGLSDLEKQELSNFAQRLAEFEEFPEEPISNIQDILRIAKEVGLAGRPIEMSTDLRPYGSYMVMSCAMMPYNFGFGAPVNTHLGRGGGRTIAPAEFKYNESRFPAKVIKKSWELVKSNLTQNQWAAFMGEKTIELQNKTGTHRLLINKGGNFTVLEGATGEGINILNGRISEGDYPLGDEISAFIDWFRLRTEKLIASWGCGHFAIRKNRPSADDLVLDRRVDELMIDEAARIDARDVMEAAQQMRENGIEPDEVVIRRLSEIQPPPGANPVLPEADLVFGEPVGIALDHPDKEGNTQALIFGRAMVPQNTMKKFIRRLKLKKEVK